MNEWHGAVHLRVPAEACECVRPEQNRPKERRRREPHLQSNGYKGDVPCRVEKLRGFGMTGGFRRRALQMTASFRNEGGSKTELSMHRWDRLPCYFDLGCLVHQNGMWVLQEGQVQRYCDGSTSPLASYNQPSSNHCCHSDSGGNIPAGQKPVPDQHDQSGVKRENH